MIGDFENKPTRLCLTHSDNTHTSEMSWDANVDDLLQAFYGLAIAAGWNPKAILNGMYEFIEGTDLYGWTPLSDISNSPEFREE